MESAKTATSGKSIQKSFKILDVGGFDGKRCRDHYPDDEIEVVDIKNGWDVMTYGLPYGPWKVIFANHFIEHVTDPDYFLDECRRVMTKDTILEIGTPNLNSWYNRIFFLFGYLPQSYEISYKKIYGRAIKDGTSPGGHVRVMNIPSLLHLLHDHKFSVVSVEGETSNRTGLISLLDKLITSFNPNLSSAFRIKCTI